MRTQRFGYRFVGSAFIIVALLLMLTIPALAAFTPSNGQAATLVLGQPNFTSKVSHLTQNGLSYSEGVAVDPSSHKVFVADSNNNRVLRFASIYSLTNGAAAEAVLGQPNFTSRTSHTTRNGMYYPTGVFVDANGRLWVVEENNNRVVRFDHAATLASGSNANGVLGQPNFTTNTPATTRKGMYYPISVFADTGGRLWVTDTNNNRVLRFNNAAAKANGANADGVLGQPNFTIRIAHTARNGMSLPDGAVVDAGGRLWVVDEGSNRVLRFNSAASKPNGANADGVLGQPNFTSSTLHLTQNGLNDPTGIAVDNASGRLFVGDWWNNRILVYNSAASLPNGANASYVLGQKNFTTGKAGTSATTLHIPEAVFFDPVSKVLLVADCDNSRVLMYGR
jgi:sugar lactone lactonase YvrE